MKNSSGYRSEDVDLNMLASAVFQGKWFIFIVTFLFFCASVAYSLKLNNIYKSELVVAPAEQKSGSELSGQLGGIAALAGVSIGDNKSVDKTTLALEILQSRNFVSKFINKHNILVELVAVNGWDMQSNTFVIDESLYDTKTSSWVREVAPPKMAEPSMQEAHKLFKEVLDISTDIDTGIVNITFKHYSPYFAKQCLDWLLADINDEMKAIDIKEAERSISYLEKQIEKTNISEVRATMFSLIEEQSKTLMLANARDEYMFKVIDPAFVPEEKFSPKRSLIVAVATFLGFIFGMFIVLLFPALRQEKTS